MMGDIMEKISFKNIMDLDDKYKKELRNWRNQEFVREKMLNTHIITEEEHYKFLDRVKDNDDKRIYVSFKGDKPLGVITYEYFRDVDKVEFGFYLVDEKYMNGGYGIVMEYAFLEYVFDKIKPKKVFCRTKKENAKVISLHSKFGFVEDEEENVNGNICYQSISFEIWKGTKSYIERALKTIQPDQDTYKLY